MRRHVVRPLHVVNPGRLFRRETIERGDMRSVCTSGSAFSWMVSEAEVWRRKISSVALARAGLRDEACGMTGDVDEAGARRVQAQRRARDQLRR